MKKLLSSTAAWLLIALTMLPIGVSALPPEQKKLMDMGIRYFNNTQDCVATQPTGGTGGAVSGNIYMLGDSITVRTVPKYKEKLESQGIVPTYSAVVGRSWVGTGLPKGEGWQVGTIGSGKDAVAADSAQIATSKAVVIALGTNGFGGSNPVDEIYNTIKGINATAPIFWINTAVSDASKNGGLVEFNTKLSQMESEKKLKVINWAGVVDPGGNGTANKAGLLEDGFHPNTSNGTDALANTVLASLKGTSAPTAVSSAPGTLNPSNFNPDPKAVAMFQNDLMPKIQPLIPLYQRAAQEKGLADWEILPALHNLEYGLRRVNPTNNTGFRTPFQMNANSLRSHGLPVDSDPLFQPGHELTDDEFVKAAGYAAEYWLLSDAKRFKIDAAKNVTPEEAAKMIVAYKSGAGSVWFTGKADFNLHAYAWAGYDTTPQHALPMAWGPGSPFGDEVAGTKVNKPGAATVFALLKGGNFGTTQTTQCLNQDANSTNNTTAAPVSGDKAELISKILSNGRIKWGNYGNASTQKQDVQDCLSTNTLAGLIIMAEQSGVDILMNALARDHGGCTGAQTGSDHNRGEAIDIGYYGNGNNRHNAQGDQLFSFIFNNRQVIRADQLIWQEPPTGMTCLDKGAPVDCYVFYGQDTMNQHYHHIHISFTPG